MCEEFERDHDDYNSIMTKALADRLAEAFAEYLHKRAREEWGFGKAETLTQEDLIKIRILREVRKARFNRTEKQDYERHFFFIWTSL